VIRLAAAVILALLAAPVAAQQSAPSTAPVVETALEESEAIPGQMVTLRLTILVPTYMPKPPVWPSLEAPNLLVRLPERATNPISKMIDGASWSGVTRRYLISPMVPGTFSIPPSDILVTYADPETNAPRMATLKTQALTLAGVIPQGAEGLDPFIAAESLTLTQKIDGAPDKMVPGDSAIRAVTAAITGVSPMFLPKLLQPVEIDGVAAYLDEPQVAEADERGTITGTRTERVTFVAEGGGRGEAPAVTLRWYNLQTRQVETASLDGFAIAIDGPPARSAEPRDWRVIIAATIGALVALAVAYWLARRLAPPLSRWIVARRQARLASERYAYARVSRAVRRRDLSGLLGAIDTWAERLPGTDPRHDPSLQAALTSIGATRYGRAPSPSDPRAWATLQDTVAKRRHDALRAPSATVTLGPLNPT